MTDPQPPSPYGPPAQAEPQPQPQPQPQSQPPYPAAPQAPYAQPGWSGPQQHPSAQPAPYALAQPYGTAPLRPRVNPLAIISLCASGSIVVLWVLLLIFPGIGLLPGIAGVVTGHIALAQIKRTGERGRGLAITGLAVGYSTAGLLLLGFAAWIAFIVIVGIGGAAPY